MKDLEFLVTVLGMTHGELIQVVLEQHLLLKEVNEILDHLVRDNA